MNRSDRTVIVGDIHGCFAELTVLLEQLNFGPGDRLVSVGDFLDRGPDPQSVFEFFRDTVNADAILGNHEHKHLRWYFQQKQPAASQRITRQQLGEAKYDELICYLSSLPSYIDLNEAAVVHGCFEPGIPLHRQSVDVLVGHMQAEDYLKNCYEQPWYESYASSKPLVVGHRDYSGTGAVTVFNDRVWCIDTDCVRGGRLTALVLPTFDVVSVPAAENHWARVGRSYPELRYPSDRKADQYPWEDFEALADRLQRRPEEDLDLARDVGRLQAEASTALGALIAWATDENASIYTTLIQQYSEFPVMSHAEQVRLYRRKVKVPRTFGLLNKARQGRLGVEALKQMTRFPRNAIDLAREIPHDL